LKRNGKINWAEEGMLKNTPKLKELEYLLSTEEHKNRRLELTFNPLDEESFGSRKQRLQRKNKRT
jgi:hypothetical protein